MKSPRALSSIFDSRCGGCDSSKSETPVLVAFTCSKGKQEETTQSDMGSFYLGKNETMLASVDDVDEYLSQNIPAYMISSFIVPLRKVHKYCPVKPTERN